MQIKGKSGAVFNLVIGQPLVFALAVAFPADQVVEVRGQVEAAIGARALAAGLAVALVGPDAVDGILRLIIVVVGGQLL